MPLTASVYVCNGSSTSYTWLFQWKYWLMCEYWPTKISNSSREYCGLVHVRWLESQTSVSNLATSLCHLEEERRWYSNLDFCICKSKTRTKWWSLITMWIILTVIIFDGFLLRMRWWCSGKHWCLPSSRPGCNSRPTHSVHYVFLTLPYAVRLILPSKIKKKKTVITND